MIKGKYLLFGALGITGLAGAAYLFNLNRLSAELETVTKAYIHKVSFTGLKIRIEVTLKNPTGGTVKVKYPFVKLMYGESTLGISGVKDLDFEIPKFGEKKIDPIYIDLGFISLATAAPNILKEFRGTGRISMIVKTVSTINNKLPFSKTDQLTIGK